MVRHHPPPHRVFLCRCRHRHRVLRPHLPASLLPRANAPGHPRRGSRDRLEHPVPALLDTVGHPPWLVAEQAHVVALR